MVESRVDIDPWVGSLSGKCPWRGSIDYFPRGHTYCRAVLQCLHEIIDWGILVPKNVEVDKLGCKGYNCQVYIKLE